MVLEILLLKGVSLGMGYITNWMSGTLQAEGDDSTFLFKLYKSKECSFHYPSPYTVQELEYPTASHFTFQSPNGSEQFMITMFKFIEKPTPCMEAANKLVEELRTQTNGGNIRIIEQNYNMKSLRPDYMRSRSMTPRRTRKKQTTQEKKREMEQIEAEAPIELTLEFIHLDTNFRRRIVAFYLEDNLMIFQHTVPLASTERGSESKMDIALGNYLIKNINIAEYTHNGKLYLYCKNFRFLMPSPLYRVTIGDTSKREFGVVDEDDKDYIMRGTRRSPTNQLLEGFSVELYHESFLTNDQKIDDMYVRTLDDIGSELASIYDQHVEDLVISNFRCKLVEYESESLASSTEDSFIFGEIVMETGSFNPETRVLMFRFFARRKRYLRMKRNLIRCLQSFTLSRNETLSNDFMLFHHTKLSFSIKIPRHMLIHDKAGYNPCLTFSSGRTMTSIFVAHQVTETEFSFQDAKPSIDTIPHAATEMTPTLQQNILHHIARQQSNQMRVRILSSTPIELLSFSRRQAFRVCYVMESRSHDGHTSTSCFVSTFVVTKPGTLYRIISSFPGQHLLPSFVNMFHSIHHQFMIMSDAALSSPSLNSRTPSDSLKKNPHATVQSTNSSLDKPSGPLFSTGSLKSPHQLAR